MRYYYWVVTGEAGEIATGFQRNEFFDFNDLIEDFKKSTGKTYVVTFFKEVSREEFDNATKFIKK